MDFSFKLRYHIDQVKNLTYHLVKNDGYLDLIDVLYNKMKMKTIQLGLLILLSLGYSLLEVKSV